jgi:hypothetical protein
MYTFAHTAMDNQVIFLKHQYAAQLSESEERMIRTLTQYEDEIFMLRSQIPKAFSLGVDKSYLSGEFCIQPLISLTYVGRNNKTLKT